MLQYVSRHYDNNIYVFHPRTTYVYKEKKQNFLYKNLKASIHCLYVIYMSIKNHHKRDNGPSYGIKLLHSCLVEPNPNNMSWDLLWYSKRTSFG